MGCMHGVLAIIILCVGMHVLCQPECSHCAEYTRTIGSRRIIMGSRKNMDQRDHASLQSSLRAKGQVPLPGWSCYEVL